MDLQRSYACTSASETEVTLPNKTACRDMTTTPWADQYRKCLDKIKYWDFSPAKYSIQQINAIKTLNYSLLKSTEDVRFRLKHEDLRLHLSKTLETFESLDPIISRCHQSTDAKATSCRSEKTSTPFNLSPTSQSTKEKELQHLNTTLTARLAVMTSEVQRLQQVVKGKSGSTNNSVAKEDLDHSMEAEEWRVAMKSELRTVNKENERLQEQLEKWKSLVSEAEKQLNELHGELRNVKCLLSRNKGPNAHLSMHDALEEVKRLKMIDQQLEKLQQQNTQKNDHIESLQHQISHKHQLVLEVTKGLMTQDETLRSKEENLHKQAGDIARLHDQIQAYEVSYRSKDEKVKDLRHQIESLKDCLKKKENELEEMISKLSGYEDSSKLQEKEIIQLRSQITAYEEASRVDARMLTELRKRLAIEEGTLRSDEKKMQALHHQVKLMQDISDNSLAEKKRGEQQLATVQLKWRQAEDAIRKHEEEKSGVLLECKKLEQQIESFRGDIAQKEERIAQLERENAAFSNSLLKHSELGRMTDDHLHSAKETCEQFRQRYDNLMGQIDSFHEDRIELGKQLQHASSDLDELTHKTSKELDHSRRLKKCIQDDLLQIRELTDHALRKRDENTGQPR